MHREDIYSNVYCPLLVDRREPQFRDFAFNQLSLPRDLFVFFGAGLARVGNFWFRVTSAFHFSLGEAGGAFKDADFNFETVELAENGVVIERRFIDGRRSKGGTGKLFYVELQIGAGAGEFWSNKIFAEGGRWIGQEFEGVRLHATGTEAKWSAGSARTSAGKSGISNSKGATAPGPSLSKR